MRFDKRAAGPVTARRTLVRLAVRGLLAHRARLALTGTAIVLGVAFVSTAMIFAEGTSRAFEGLYARAGAGVDVVVRESPAFGGPAEAGGAVPARLLDRIAAVPEVARAYGAVEGFAAIIDRKGAVVRSPQGLPQVGVGWTPGEGPLRLAAGTAPRGPGEIALDAATAARTGHRTGDRVTVALRGPSRVFTLSGTFTYAGSKSSGVASMAAFEPATARRLLLERPDTYSRIEVRADPGVPASRLRDAVARVLPAGVEAVTGRQASDEAARAVNARYGVFTKALLIFSFVAVFVGSFVILTTFSMLLARRARELALLRAVGATRRQVRGAVLGEAFGIGVAGSTLGLAAGAGLAALLRAVFAAAGVRLPAGGVAPSASSVAWAYGVGTLVTLAAAYPAARRAATVPPVAALRSDVETAPRAASRRRAVIGAGSILAGAIAVTAGTGRGGDAGMTLVGGGLAVMFTGVTVLSPFLAVVVIGPAGRPLTRLLGVIGRLAVRNALRDPRRTAATASALSVGMTLVTGVTVLNASLRASLDDPSNGASAPDVTVTAAGETPFDPAAAGAVARVPGVRKVVPVRAAPVRLDGVTAAARAADPPALVAAYGLRMVAGAPSHAAGTLLVDQGTAAWRGWHVGSTVTAHFPDGATARLRITGIFAGNQYGPAQIITEADRAAHSRTRLVDELAVTAAPGTGTAAVRAALRAWPGLDVRDEADRRAELRGGVDEFFSLILVLLALSIVIAVLGIVNTLALAVHERTREIGLLRAVGLDRRGLRRAIRVEAVLVALFGALVGLALGVAFGAVVQNAASDEIDVLRVPYGRLALYAAGAVVVGVAAAAWPARRAARTDILRAIAAE